MPPDEAISSANTKDHCPLNGPSGQQEISPMPPGQQDRSIIMTAHSSLTAAIRSPGPEPSTSQPSRPLSHLSRDASSESEDGINSEPIEVTIANSDHSPPVIHLSPDQGSDDEVETDPEPIKMTSGNSNYTLVERTRKSMSLIPPLPSHEALVRPRHHRGPRSSFPVNQFETPRNSSGARSGASTPQDKLFEEDAEYASVFKSRPRVALSPVSSPAVHVSPSIDLDEDFDLGYEDTEPEYVDSPSTSRYRR